MKINKKQKQLIQIYIVLFALMFVTINWGSVSWVFNYRVMSGLAYDFFNPYQEHDVLAASKNTAAANAPSAQPVENNVPVVVRPVYPYTNKSNSIEIPSISITSPLIVGRSTDILTVTKELDGGVVYYPGSVQPGASGQMVVLGHSAPPNWPHIKYDWVFTDINNLNLNDVVILNFDNHQYTYKVKSKEIVKKGDDVGLGGLPSDSNILTLVSCWPPGKDYKRIAVHAELQIQK